MTTVHEDVLKRQFGGVSEDRCDEAYLNGNGSAAALQESFSQSYLLPEEHQINGNQLRLAEFLNHGRFSAVIPMRERGPVIESVLATLTGQLNPSQITVVNCDSDDDALNCVRRFDGVKLVFQTDLLDCLDWQRLLPLLSLEKQPRGKGVTVLAGYLYHFGRTLIGQKPPEFLFQSDAEIAEYKRYQCLEYLVHGLIERSDSQYVKSGKFGRTNERCMAARSMLNVLSNCEELPFGIKSRARDLFARLVPHKWMLCGEFAMSWNLAMHRPFATGYLEETLVSAFVEDYAATLGRSLTCQVANPNPRLDGANNDRKESIMQQQISNFLLMLALLVRPVDEWNLEDIARINRDHMSKPIIMGWIPPNDGPVVSEIIANDRIIPSISTLRREGFIDETRLAEVASA